MNINKYICSTKRVVIIILSALLLATGGTGIYACSLLSSIEQTDKNPVLNDMQNPEVPTPAAIEPALVITPSPACVDEKKPKKIINIALFGLDSRDSEACRTDTIMIGSIDRNNKVIKLTSLMRDMYVQIPGEHNNRINAAYAYGGPSLALEAINTNFQMDIKYYASVDFKGLQRLIDKLGGVEIDVKRGEIRYLNIALDEMNKKDRQDPEPHVKKPGVQHLMGKQAVAYMRIRYYGDGDFERTQRQRVVLAQLFDKVKKLEVLKFPGLVSSVLPYIKTNMPKLEIIGLGINCLGFDSVEQYRIPEDGMYWYQEIDGKKVLVPDIEENTWRLHEFIYGKPEEAFTGLPGDRLPEGEE